MACFLASASHSRTQSLVGVPALFQLGIGRTGEGEEVSRPCGSRHLAQHPCSNGCEVGVPTLRTWMGATLKRHNGKV